jgi:hypothetical protein
MNDSPMTMILKQKCVFEKMGVDKKDGFRKAAVGFFILRNSAAEGSDLASFFTPTP